MSEATYLLLLTLAGMMRGNDENHQHHRVPLPRLLDVVEVILQGIRPYDLPDVISYQELKRLVELRALRSYSDRYHRATGLKKSQNFYSKAEAQAILSSYPDYSHVYEHQQAS